MLRYDASMRLIIDGYNVLHETMPPPLAGLDEAGLCRALDASVWRSKSPVVVCDGRPKPLGLTEVSRTGVLSIRRGVEKD